MAFTPNPLRVCVNPRRAFIVTKTPAASTGVLSPPGPVTFTIAPRKPIAFGDREKAAPVGEAPSDEGSMESIKNICMSILDTKGNPSPKLTNIDDLSSFFNKAMMAEISKMVGALASSEATKERASLVSNIYMMVSMFVATLKVVGIEFKLASAIAGEGASIVDLAYKGAMTLCAMKVVPNASAGVSSVLLTLEDTGLFADPMSVPQCGGAPGVGAGGCTYISQTYKNFLDVPKDQEDGYMDWLRCVHETARKQLQELLDALVAL